MRLRVGLLITLKLKRSLTTIPIRYRLKYWVTACVVGVQWIRGLWGCTNMGYINALEAAHNTLHELRARGLTRLSTYIGRVTLMQMNSRGPAEHAYTHRRET
eukprot:1506417-Pyramimonas_sp.AAC.1